MTTFTAPRLRVWFRIDVLVFGQQAPPPALLQDISDSLKQSATKLQAKTPHAHVGTIQRLQVPFPVPFTRVSFSCQMNVSFPGDATLADDLVKNEQYQFCDQVLSMLAQKHRLAQVVVMARNDNGSDLRDACVLTLGFQEDDLLTFRQTELKAIAPRASLFWHRFWDDEESEPSMWAAFQQWRPVQFQEFLVKLQHAHLDSALAPNPPSGPAPRF